MHSGLVMGGARGADSAATPPSCTQSALVSPRLGQEKTSTKGQGDSGGQRLPLPHPQQPLADLTPGLGLGGGGCSLGPRGRRQEVLCVCLAPETPVLPPACSLPPGPPVCGLVYPAALAARPSLLPGGAPAAPASTCPVLAAPEAAGQHNHPAVDTVVDFGEGREEREGRRKAAKAFNASLVNLQLALAILQPTLPPPHPFLGEAWASSTWAAWATHHTVPKSHLNPQHRTIGSHRPPKKK